MSRLILPSAATGLLLVLCGSLSAEYRAPGLSDASEARRYGLETAWTTRIEVDPARGRLMHIQSFVSARKSYTAYVVKYGEGDRQRAFSERDLNRWGELLGKTGAERAAQEFIKELKARGLEGEISSQEVPEITLYVTTDRGVVQAIDAETGRTLWATLVGNRDYPTERPGVNEDYVAVLNGTSLYVLSRETGALVWVRRTKGVPAAGPAVSDIFAVVPTYSGNIELYDLEEVRTLPKMYMSNGRALIQPTVTTLSIAWPTDRGFMYVARATDHGIRYRLETKNTIVAPITYMAPNALLVGSIDGYVYCLKEIGNGEEVWRFSAGEGIISAPAPVGEAVYVVSERNNLFSIDKQTGQLRWMAPDIKRFLASSSDRLYCLSTADQVDILDVGTGGRIASLPPLLWDVYHSNLLTDRILVGTQTGVLQCLREIDQRWPLLHVDLEERQEEPQRPEIRQEGLPEASPKPQPQQPGEPASDPFGGGGADPFGGGAGGADPFGGGGADPFGGGGAGAGGANPFGGGAGAGGADPFGGGGAGAGGTNPFGGGGAGAGGADPFGGGGGGGAGGADPFGGGGAGAGGGADPFGP